MWERFNEREWIPLSQPFKHIICQNLLKCRFSCHPSRRWRTERLPKATLRTGGGGRRPSRLAWRSRTPEATTVQRPLPRTGTGVHQPYRTRCKGFCTLSYRKRQHGGGALGHELRPLHVWHRKYTTRKRSGHFGERPRTCLFPLPWPESTAQKSCELRIMSHCKSPTTNY